MGWGSACKLTQKIWHPSGVRPLEPCSGGVGGPKGGPPRPPANVWQPFGLLRIRPQEAAGSVDVPIMAWLPQMPGIVLGCAVAWLVATGVLEAAGRAAGLSD